MLRLTMGCAVLIGVVGLGWPGRGWAESTAVKRDTETVKLEHAGANISDGDEARTVHTTHPDAQWFPEAGFGLFFHWDISSVKEMNISWPMIPGKTLGRKRVDDPAERERIIRERDLDGTGKPWTMTPNAYWAMAKDFNPQKYDPDKWLAAAKAAGMTYAVLTTRHHDGFANWPSDFGSFNTKNYMGGRDLVKPFVEACRKNGLKVGLYYSGPDWYFERDFKDFFSYARRNTPEFPELDADLKPRTTHKSAEEIAAHQKAYQQMVQGQVEELLTRYGKIDLLWFDGAPPIPNGDNAITKERIRELQPGIVINPRLHGTGDFVTYERVLKTGKVAKTWAEFCNTWAVLWTYERRREAFKADGFVLGELALCRSLGINYLLGVGPDKDGELNPYVYEGFARFAEWMKVNGESVQHVKPLAKGESANVPATRNGNMRYLFLIPAFNKESRYLTQADMLPATDAKLVLKGVGKPKSVTFLNSGKPLDSTFSGGSVTVKVPAALRTTSLDVVRIELNSK